MPAGTEAGSRSSDEARTTAGTVRGTVTEDYRRFRGVPFAAPPTGDLRWSAPQPPASWEGVRDTTTAGPRCAQNSAFGDSEESTAEDCLYLDITSPATEPAKPRPVMVWLHGGGFTEGAGSDADARRLAVDGDVVVVTINYRLGIFGLFGMNGLHDSGTYGLQDQVAALDWVRSNIESFGGDPTNVTLFGESAGAKSICALLTSPTAEGLFHRAIMQSGPCTGTVPAGMMFPGLPEFDQWMPVTERAAMGAATARRLGCQDAELECLRRLPAEALLAAHSEFITPAFGGPALPQHPSAAIKAGDFHRVPVLSGTTQNELTYLIAAFHDSPGHPITAADYRTLLDLALGRHAKKISATYPLSSFQSPSQAWATVTTDRVFTCPAETRHTALAEHVSTFVYEYAEPERKADYPGLTFDPGAVHAGELPLLFPDFEDPAALTEQQRPLSDSMIKSWSSFARSGIPSTAGEPWPARSAADPTAATSLSSSGFTPVDIAADHHCETWLAVDPGVS